MRQTLVFRRGIYEETSGNSLSGNCFSGGRGERAGVRPYRPAGCARGTPASPAYSAARVGRWVLSLEWQSICLGSRLLGSTAAAARTMGSGTLDTSAARVLLDRRPLALEGIKIEAGSRACLKTVCLRAARSRRWLDCYTGTLCIRRGPAQEYGCACVFKPPGTRAERCSF